MDNDAEIERLIARLATGSKETRRQAAADPGERLDPRAIPPLIRALLETHAPEVSTALANFDARLIVPPLLDAYIPANEAVQANYATLDAWLNVRVNANLCLQTIADKGEEAVPVLLDLLRASENGLQREAVVAAFGRISHPFGLIPLLDSIRKYYGSRVIPVMTSWLSDATLSLRSYGVCVLTRIGTPQTIAPLIRHLRQSPEDCREMPSLLDASKTHFVKPLIGCLDADDAVRGIAVACLLAIRDKRAVEPLLRLLPNAGPAICEDVALRIGQLQDERALEPLLKLLSNPSLSFYPELIIGIGAFKDDRVVPALLGILEKASEDMGDFPFVARAVCSLGRIGTPLALRSLRELADNPTASIEARAYASMALERNEEYWQPIERGEGSAHVARFE